MIVKTLRISELCNVSTTTIASSFSSVAKPKEGKVNCAVYGCGLSASGALAIPKLVVNNSDATAVTAKEAKFPKRISAFNLLNIRYISSGFGFSLFASNNKLFGAGLNNRFQVAGTVGNLEEKRGQDYYISSKKISLPFEDKIIGLSSGRAHSLIATSSHVYALGDNSFGQCGLDPTTSDVSVGTTQTPLNPVRIPSSSRIRAVHCSMDTSFVLTEAGEIFAFGLNEDGQCGNEAYGIQWDPRKVTGDVVGEKIVRIGGSTDTLTALSQRGEVFLWGQNEYGQSCGAYEDIQLLTSRRIPLPGISKVTSFGTTATGCVVSSDKGEVFTWGVGLLGLGPNTQKLARHTAIPQPIFEDVKVTEVFAGNTNSAAVTEKGRLFVWGENRFASVGLGHDKYQLFPYQVYLPGNVRNVSLGPDHSLFLVR